MEKLSYKPYSSSISDVVFLETNNYYDPSSPMETRKQLSYPLKEVKDFVNNTVSVDSNDNAVQLVVSSENTLKYRTSVGGTLTDITVAGLQKMSVLTQAQYDALDPKDATTLYFVYTE
jgi:hypothetical protein